MRGSRCSDAFVANPATPIVDYVLQWLAGEDAREPFFLYVHSTEPHSPYDPPTRHRERFAPRSDARSPGTREALDRLRRGETSATPELRDELRNLYDAEVAYADESVGKLLDELRRRDLYDEALVVFLSDHGEELHERGGWEHGHTLHRELLDVPLLMKPPGSRGLAAHRVARLVRQTDVLPTVLELAGADPLATAEGQSLVTVLRGSRAPPKSGRPLDATGDTTGGASAYAFLELVDHAGASITNERWRLVETVRPDRRRQLFEIARDPDERGDRSDARPVLAGYLASRLREQLRRTPGDVEHSEMDPLTRERMRALGYVD